MTPALNHHPEDPKVPEGNDVNRARFNIIAKGRFIASVMHGPVWIWPDIATPTSVSIRRDLGRMFIIRSLSSSR